MINPFEPLYSLVVIATSRYGRLFVTGPGGGSPLATTDSRPRDQSQDCHTLAPDTEMIAFEGAWSDDFEPFQYRPLYTVVWRESPRRIWIARNSHAPFMLPPPTPSGPVTCACPDATTGETDGRYSRLTNAYPFQAAQYTDRLFYRPYAPDLFSGAGPCAARLEPGFLTEWDPAWIELNGDMYQFTNEFANQVEITDEVDDLVGRALGITMANISPHGAVAREASYMKAAWARYVLRVLDRRAQNVERLIARGEWKMIRERDVLTWVNIRDEGYFDTGGVGAWFADASARRVKILELMQRGLPVFYLWSPELEDLAPALAMPAEARARLGLGGHGWSLSSTARVPTYEEAVMGPSTDQEAGESQRRDYGPVNTEEDARAPDVAYPSEPEYANPPRPAALLDRIGPARDEDDEDLDMDDSTDEATWSRIADTLDEMEGVGIGAMNPAPPSAASEEPPQVNQEVPFPTEGYHFHIVHSARLSTRLGNDITSVPCKRVDQQVQRLLQDDTNFLEELVPPRNRILSPDADPAGASLLTGPALLIYDDGLVRRALGHAFAQGVVKDVADLVEFLVENGIRFATGVRVVAPAPLRVMHLHKVDDGMWFKENEPIQQQFRIWQMSVLVLAERRPHFARAAVARGGLLNLVIRTFIEPRFPLRPTKDVFEYGSPHGITVGDRILHDDWLSAAEEALLIGRPHTSSTRSLLPPVKVFNRVYAGVLSNEIEGWFRRRLRELRNGKKDGMDVDAKGLMNATDWKRALRSASRSSWYGA